LKFEKHIFICTNKRIDGHPRGCCDPAGNEEMQKVFKKKLAERGLKGRVRANRAGCLDQCEHGPNMVVYPEGIFYGKVRIEDIDEIIESHIIGDVPVARLVLADSCVNAVSCEHKQR